MNAMTKALALVAGLGLAAPAMASDASDTATEKKAQARKKARSLKPGEKSLDDRTEDAKDTARETGAKAKKSARKAGHKAKKDVHDATK
jgi:hypothetical protein